MKTKIYNGLRWVIFFPLQYIFLGMTLFFVQFIPVVWIINKLFDLGDANPLETKIVSGPIGFLLVYVLLGVAYTISTVLSVFIAPKPILAWKITWTIHLISYLVGIMVYEITEKNLLPGNLWYNLAVVLAALTAAIKSRFMVLDEEKIKAANSVQVP